MVALWGHEKRGWEQALEGCMLLLLLSDSSLLMLMVCQGLGYLERAENFAELAFTLCVTNILFFYQFN